MQDALFCTVSPVVLLHCKSRKEPEHAGTLRLLYCPAATGEHTSADQQPECTSRAILILLSCGTSGVSPRRGRGIDIGHCSIIFSAWQHCQAGSLPSYPVSCCCGQLRTDREYPAVHLGGFFHTPGPAKTPGSFYTLPLLTNTPPLKRAPWCTGEVAGSIQPAPMCVDFLFTTRP